MTIQPIGATSMALYITPNDLKEHGLTPDQLTLERALDLTQTAFRQAGVALEGALEIEAYPDSLGVLVFAHVHPPERVWFSFGELEEVLAAAPAGGRPALVGGALLALPPGGGAARHCPSLGVWPGGAAPLPAGSPFSRARPPGASRERPHSALVLFSNLNPV